MGTNVQVLTFTFLKEEEKNKKKTNAIYTCRMFEENVTFLFSYDQGTCLFHFSTSG